MTSLAATFDELLDRIGWGYDIDVEYKGRTYLLSDCAYLGGWQVICNYNDEDPQSYRDRETSSPNARQFTANRRGRFGIS